VLTDEGWQMHPELEAAIQAQGDDSPNG